MASLLLAAPDAQAGSYTDTQSGGTNPSTVTPAADAFYSYPQDAVAGGAPLPNGNGAPTITVNPGTITDTFTWVPDSGKTLTTDPPPSCVIIEQDSYVEWHTIDEEGNGTTGSGQANCGLPGATIVSSTGDPYGPALSLAGTLYSLKASPGASFSVSCSPTASFTGQIGTQGGSVEGEAKVSGGASIVNGNWDGPYYFHYGNYYGGSSEGVWANNTVSSKPAITDVPDTMNLFSHAVTDDNNCTVTGSITPVWYWNGPDLGVPPPGFRANITTTAFARDYNEVPDEELDADDGLENTPEYSPPPNSAETNDTDPRGVDVESDVYAPGEGNGYWALGPTIDLNAAAGDPSEVAPFNLYASVELTAEIFAP